MGSLEDNLADQITSVGLVQQLLHQKLQDIEAAFVEGAALGDSVDAVMISSPMQYGIESLVRIAIETEGGPKSNELLVILQTEGGYIEVVELIVNILRHHYAQVSFLIPSAAMSAGTVLAMSGDRIFMDYSSTLGPIDPQVERPDSSKLVPVQGYLSQYRRLLKRADEGKLNTAEFHILTSFDQAEIHMFEQAVELSVSLLKDWLVEYKFKDWSKTEGKKKMVSLQMKKNRAVQIAKMLNDTEVWHTHGRGISMKVLQEKIGLRIDDFGKLPNLHLALLRYRALLNDYRTHQLQSPRKGLVHAPGALFSL